MKDRLHNIGAILPKLDQFFEYELDMADPYYRDQSIVSRVETDFAKLKYDTRTMEFNLDIQHIPYAGENSAMTAVVGKHAHLDG